MTDWAPPPLARRTSVPSQRGPWLPPEPGTDEPSWAGRSTPGQPVEAYAHWWRRVAASVLDMLLAVPFLAAGVIGIVTLQDGTTIIRDGSGALTDVAWTTSTWVGLAIVAVSYVGLVVFGVWNQVVRQGRRGASIGKACLNLVVVDDRRGRPIGVLLTFVRGMAHLLDGLPFYLGYLWPLVDERRQTFADKVMGTVVLHLPPLPLPTPAPEPPLPYGW